MRYQALVEALEAVVPEPAAVQRFMPIRATTAGTVEVHAHDRQAHP